MSHETSSKRGAKFRNARPAHRPTSISRERRHEARDAETKREQHHEGADEGGDERHDENGPRTRKPSHAPLERFHIGGSSKAAKARQGILKARLEAQEKRLAAREFLLDASELLLDARKLVQSPALREREAVASRSDGGSIEGSRLAVSDIWSNLVATKPAGATLR
jgi:hypothetical protein